MDLGQALGNLQHSLTQLQIKKDRNSDFSNTDEYELEKRDQEVFDPDNSDKDGLKRVKTSYNLLALAKSMEKKEE